MSTASSQGADVCTLITKTIDHELLAHVTNDDSQMSGKTLNAPSCWKSPAAGEAAAGAQKRK